MIRFTWPSLSETRIHVLESLRIHVVESLRDSNRVSERRVHTRNFSIPKRDTRQNPEGNQQNDRDQQHAKQRERHNSADSVPPTVYRLLLSRRASKNFLRDRLLHHAAVVV
jgi:hypothetical protein